VFYDSTWQDELMKTMRIQYEKLLAISAKQPNLQADELIGSTLAEFGAERVVLASSLSAEDQVLTHLLSGATSTPRIFTLDTGRLFPETYAAMEKSMQRYGFRYEVMCPNTRELESMLREHGPNLFYRSVELRKVCCSIRKAHPLKRVLTTASVWICGLRREQSITRGALKPVEWDATNGIVKINPLHDWTEKQVWNFIHSNNIPYNLLQDCGFRSIGCAPCTRAVTVDDDVRAGRWWWEEPEHKECGLHSGPHH
jgi:phosphoadenosine phosphosulfate reductase